MPSAPRPAIKRIIALGLLWTAVGLMGWLIAMQLAIALFEAKGEWQAPDYYQATVVELDKYSTPDFNCDVYVLIGGEQETITLPRAEARHLHPHDTVWILDNYYVTPTRPPQYLLTPTRVISQYMAVLLALALLVLYRLRRSPWGVPPPPPEIPESERKVFRDNFHERAQRHAPHENPSTNPPDPVE